VPAGNAQPRPPLDLPTYERFIADGIAAADGCGTPVDHVTARRLAIWLAARPQAPVFARSLVHFVNIGAVSQALRTQLRIHARGAYPGQPQSARLMEYCVARGAETGQVGEDFGVICDQIDRADVMLAGLRDRTRRAARPAQESQAEDDGPEVIALARRDPRGRTISIVMDAAANIAMFAITAHARDREAHLREVERTGQALPGVPRPGQPSEHRRPRSPPRRPPAGRRARLPHRHRPRRSADCLRARPGTPRRRPRARLGNGTGPKRSIRPDHHPGFLTAHSSAEARA
jgi:hypothetical protein